MPNFAEQLNDLKIALESSHPPVEIKIETSEIEDFTPLFKILSKISNLESLTLKLHSLSDNNLKSFLDALETSGNHFEALILSDTPLDKVFDTLVKELNARKSKFRQLNTLVLHHTRLKSSHLPSLISLLSNFHWQKLDMSNNLDLFSLENLNQAASFTKQLAATPSLKELNLATLGLTNQAGFLLAPVITALKELSYLNLANNHFGAKGLEPIFKALKKTPVSTLDISSNNFILHPNDLEIAPNEEHADVKQALMTVEAGKEERNRIGNIIANHLPHTSLKSLNLIGIGLNYDYIYEIGQKISKELSSIYLSVTNDSLYRLTGFLDGLAMRKSETDELFGLAAIYLAPAHELHLPKYVKKIIEESIWTIDSLSHIGFADGASFAFIEDIFKQKRAQQIQIFFDVLNTIRTLAELNNVITDHSYTTQWLTYLDELTSSERPPTVENCIDVLEILLKVMRDHPAYKQIGTQPAYDDGIYNVDFDAQLRILINDYFLDERNINAPLDELNINDPLKEMEKPLTILRLFELLESIPSYYSAMYKHCLEKAYPTDMKTQDIDTKRLEKYNLLNSTLPTSYFFSGTAIDKASENATQTNQINNGLKNG